MQRSITLAPLLAAAPTTTTTTATAIDAAGRPATPVTLRISRGTR